MKKKHIMKILDIEIEWCEDNSEKYSFDARYIKGFINGLIQAKFLINELSNIKDKKIMDLLKQ